MLTLRIANQSMRHIAAFLGCDVATVSRDWQWIQANWGKEYGESPSMNVPSLIGDSVARLVDIEEQARATYAELNEAVGKSDGPPITQIASAKMRCLRMAEIARMDILHFLQDLGVLDRQLGHATVSLMRATDLRKALRAEGFLDASSTIDVEPERVTDGSLQRWLTDGQV